MLVPAAELTGPLYGIVAGGPEGPRFVEARNRQGMLRLVFRDYGSAREMAAWMGATKARTIGRGVRLLLGGDEIAGRYPTPLTAIRVDHPGNAKQCGATNATGGD